MNEEVEKELREQAQAIDRLTAQIYLLTQRVTFLENEAERKTFREIQKSEEQKEKLRNLACRLKMLDAQAFTFLDFSDKE